MFVRVFITALIFCFSLANAEASPKIQHWQTSNGARVYFVKAAELPMLDVRVIFDAGAARDKALPGTALMTNAMLDEGAGGMTTNQIATAFENVGAEFGSSSQRDMALLSLRTLTSSKAMDTALDTFSKVLNKPSFPKDSFERLRKQVLTGLQAEQQSPGSIASRLFFKKLYGNHPYATMPAGDKNSVTRMKIADLKAFYDRFYVANNAEVVLVGALTTAQAKQIAEQLTAGLKQGKKAPALPAVTALNKGEQLKIAYPSTQTHILMGQPGLSRGDADYFALYVGNHILGGNGLVSLLSNEVREKRGLSYSVYSYLIPMRQQGPYQFGLQTRNKKATEALKVMRDTLNRFIKDGPTEAQLKAAKQNITGGFALRVDSNRKVADYLAMLGFYQLPLDYLDTFVSNVNAVTTKQIQDVFKRRIHPDKMITVLVGGEDK